MPKFEIYYARDISQFIFGGPKDFTRETMAESHVFLREITAGSLDAVFHDMQAEVWSPNGEARETIERLGLWHTSMSVGDIAVDCEAGTAFMCQSIGWKLVLTAFELFQHRCRAFGLTEDADVREVFGSSLARQLVERQLAASGELSSIRLSREDLLSVARKETTPTKHPKL